MNWNRTFFGNYLQHTADYRLSRSSPLVPQIFSVRICRYLFLSCSSSFCGPWWSALLWIHSCWSAAQPPWVWLGSSLWLESGSDFQPIWCEFSLWAHFFIGSTFWTTNSLSGWSSLSCAYLQASGSSPEAASSLLMFLSLTNQNIFYTSTQHYSASSATVFAAKTKYLLLFYLILTLYWGFNL